MAQSSPQSKKKYKQTVKGKEAEAKYRENRRLTPRGRAGLMLKNTRQDAKKRNRTCCLTVEWLEQKLIYGLCEKTGIPFVLNDKEDASLTQKTRKHPFAPSLERRDSTKDYTPENTIVVCLMYNYAKNVFEEDAVEQFCRAYLAHNGLV
jgi:hypothetical protein